MKHGDTLRTAIKYGSVALLSFGVGRLSTHFIESLFEWPRTPEWMDVNATSVVVNGVVALGTCAAVLVALVLAVRQSQQKARDDMGRAKLIAAGVSERLKIIRTRASVALTFVETRGATAKRASFKHYGNSLHRIVPVSLDEIQALAPMNDHCAPKLAAGLERFTLARSYMEALGSGDEETPIDQSTLDFQARMLREAVSLLDDARRTIKASNDSFEFQKSIKNKNEIESATQKTP
ncbi:hypothetical protein LGM43_26785 [Burkholderia seminalis]|uniref:hypothetical protein n=1 Tax=Burkholderia seminalis TaxID=488731 RepID=UPI001CF43946|nr:hypothetical protein [Burkholderia seminalis]MCA7953880.1 hypothetical protein [Burkholderia seminalis]